MVHESHSDVDGETAEASADHSASLARLRLFLAPHSPVPLAPHHSSISSVGDEQDNTSQSVRSLEPEASASDDQKLECDARTNNSSDGVATDDNSVDRCDACEDSEQAATIAAPGAVASVSPLSQSSSEFARVKHLLQSCLVGYSVQDDVTMWDMTNPELLAQYEQHARGLLELDSWVAVNDLGAAMRDVHRYGFTALDATQTSMKFTTGTLQLSEQLTTAPPRRTQQLVLCKIAVGRSLVIEREESATQPLPPGFSSFYLQPPSTASALDADDRGYYHEYILTSTYQVLPQYLVRFRVSPIGAKSAGPCALCEQHTAVIVCRACEAEICAACDEQVHSANKLVRRHKRVPLRAKRLEATGSASSRAARRRSSTPSVIPGTGDASSATPELQNTELTAAPVAAEIDAVVAKQLEDGLADVQSVCRVHDGKRVEFYCSVCEVPVCVHCKMVGDHSVGDKGAHRLLALADAYELSVRESLKPDPLVESRKSVIEHRLCALAATKATVAHNRETVAAAIRQQCDHALERLDDLVRAKARVLDSEVLELERQLQQIAWTDETLDDLRASSSAVEFLATWHQHKAVRAELRDFPAFAHGASAEHVKGDLALVGRLQVVSSEQQMSSLPVASAPAHELLASGSHVPGTRGDSVRLGASQSSRHADTTSSDIRKKLLSMKAPFPSECVAAASALSARSASTTQPPGASATLLSARGMQMIEDIRAELLTKSAMLATSSGSRTATFASRAAVSPSSGRSNSVFRTRPAPSPTQLKTTICASSPLRSLSVEPVRAPVHHPLASPREQQRTRLVSNAWSTLLRQELARSSSESDDV